MVGRSRLRGMGIGIGGCGGIGGGRGVRIGGEGV